MSLFGGSPGYAIAVSSLARMGARARHYLRSIIIDSASFLGLLVKTFRGLPTDVLAASVFINLLGLALPLGILQVYDRIVPHSATSTLALLTIGIACALAMETILRITRSRVIAWSAMTLAWKTNVEAASRVALAPAKLVDSQPVARWIQRLQAVAAISEFNISPAPLVLIDLAFVVIFLALLVAISGWIAAVPLAIFLVFGLTAIEKGRELRTTTAERMVAETRIRDFMIETLNGIVTVKALGTEQQILRRFERLQEHAAGSTHDVVRLADEAQSFGSMVSIFTQIATATIGAVLAVNGSISVGVVACSTMLAGRVIQPLLRLVAAWNEIQGVIVSEEIAKPIFDLPEGDRLIAPIADGGARSPASVRFDNVRFAHTGSSAPILCEANLEIAAGEIIAITGRDNIGKSTIARLIAGQLTPDLGEIFVDGVPANIAHARVRGSIALIDHQNATIRGSVLNNLTLFRPERTAAARTAARLINLERDINRLPRGYDTRLGESATETLTAGFLQRVAIVRAIASGPRLLVLDEANASLDYGADLALSKGILSLKGEITIVLITNRPSFAAMANRLFTVADGKLCELEPKRFLAEAAEKVAEAG